MRRKYLGPVKVLDVATVLSQAQCSEQPQEYSYSVAERNTLISLQFEQTDPNSLYAMLYGLSQHYKHGVFEKIGEVYLSMGLKQLGDGRLPQEIGKAARGLKALEREFMNRVDQTGNSPVTVRNQMREENPGLIFTPFYFGEDMARGVWLMRYQGLMMQYNGGKEKKPRAKKPSAT